MTVALVPMTLADIDAVVAIESIAAPRPWTAGVFADELAQPQTRSYTVATVDGVVVGFCGLLVAADEGHITNIAVDPANRRSGIATRLVLDAFTEARQRGAWALTLEVRASNSGAQRLYHRFGFVPSGVRPRYYDDNGEDAIIMWTEAIADEAMRSRLDTIQQNLALQEQTA